MISFPLLVNRAALCLLQTTTNAIASEPILNFFIYKVFVKNKWYPEPIPYGRGFHSLLTPFGVQTRASLQTTTLRVASEPILDLFIYKVFVKNKWCPEPESNQRHVDFQSTALPTELSGQT